MRDGMACGIQREWKGLDIVSSDAVGLVKLKEVCEAGLGDIAVGKALTNADVVGRSELDFIRKQILLYREMSDPDNACWLSIYVILCLTWWPYFFYNNLIN